MNSLSWSSLSPPLCESNLATVKRLGFSTMTAVQASTIPLFTTNKDVVVQVCNRLNNTICINSQ